MIDSKNEDSGKKLLESQADMITDLVVRVSALERVLIEKNVIPESEYVAEIIKVTEELSGLVSILVEKNSNSDAK